MRTSYQATATALALAGAAAAAAGLAFAFASAGAAAGGGGGGACFRWSGVLCFSFTRIWRILERSVGLLGLGLGGRYKLISIFLDF